MKKNTGLFSFLIVVLFQFVTIISFSQNVGIGTSSPDASAQLDITNTNKGLLIPRMSTSGIASINNPARGLMVYDSAKNQLMVNMGSAALPDWQTIVFKSGWSLSGNSGTVAATHFIGTIDSVVLKFKVKNQPAGQIDPGGNGNTSLGWGTFTNLSSGRFNVGLGNQALYSNNTGDGNVASGYRALFSNTNGNYNVATGGEALYSNLSGNYNVANGTAALRSNTNGVGNIAIGIEALHSNTSGSNNVANGTSALRSNTTGNLNVATGGESLFSNTTGIENVANGTGSLRANTTGNFNAANGTYSLYANTTGNNNTANGYGALYTNTTGGENVANGVQALFLNTSGGGNVASGVLSLHSNTIGIGNVATGAEALRHNTTGNYNTAIGTQAGNNITTTPSNFTAIGYNAGHVNSVSNRVEIGNTSVDWIGGQVGWSTYSDEKIKDDIRDNVPGLSFINKLRPITYRLNVKRQNQLCDINDKNEWEGKYDIEKEVQTGFIAQEVEQAAQSLQFSFSGVTPPKDNSKLYSLQYAAFVVPLVKAVQEQQQIIENQQKQIDELNKKLDLVLKNK